MICSSKDNSIKFLLENGATDDVRKVIDIAKFDEANEKLTRLAQTKYGLDTMGGYLFSIAYESKKYMDEPSYRESSYTIPRAIPNEPLFNQLDNLIDQYENREAVEETAVNTPFQFRLFDEFEDLTVFEYNLSDLQNARTREVATVLAERLSIGLKTNYVNITQQEARNLLKNSPIPYQGEPAFYFAGSVYTVGGNVSVDTVLHEFSHPLLQGIRQTNPRLFEQLYFQLAGTTEGQEIIKRIQKGYPELEFESPRFMEEALAYGLQRRASNRVTKQLESDGFDSFIKNLLNQIKQLLKNIFGNKVKVARLNESTTLDQLADMLLEKDFEFETDKITPEDAAAFVRFEIDRAKVLTDNASSKAVTDAINAMFVSNNTILERAKNFKADKKTAEAVKKSLLREGTSELTPGIKKSLQGYQTVVKSNRQSVDDVIDNALNAEQKRLRDLNNRAVSLVSSLDVTLNITQLIQKELERLQKKSNFGSRSDIALLGLYKGSLTRWYQSISDIDQILKADFNLTTDNPFSNLLNEITRNIIRGQEIITGLYKDHSVQFFVEITGYMSDFVKEQLRTDLGNALKGVLTENEFEDLYNKIVQQKIEDSDLEALAKKGVEVKYINNFIERYNYFVINENKIQDILEGKFKDVSIINRFMESYSSSTSPIVGSLSIYIENQKRQAEQQMWTKSMKFRKKLETLLPKVAEFSKWNTRQMLDLVAEKDSVAFFNRKTGQMEKREVYTFLNEFGNGWRYDLDVLEHAVDEARNSGDVEKLRQAMKDLRRFKADYMHDEYVPEYYEKDAIFDSSPIAQDAWLDRKLALDEFSAEANKLNNELERFEQYATTEAAWRKYQQLYSLYYEDGSPKVDDPENGVFDLSKAKILREHREQTRDFNEFVPIPGSLQTAYNEFANLLESQGIKRGDELFAEKVKEWTKQNTRLVYDESYYTRVKELRTRLSELQEKANAAVESDFDISGAFKQISDLIFGFKDEQGQPDPTALGEDRLLTIKELQQQINDYKFNFDNSSGLSRDELDELRGYAQALKTRKLTKDEETRYVFLVGKQSGKGLTIEEIAELEGIFSELGDLSMRVPTEYYLDELNYNLSKYNVGAIAEDKVNDYINSDEFFDILEQDKNFYDWFLLNHVTRKVWSTKDKRYVDRFERTMANSVTIPKDPSMIKTTDIIDESTGETISILGVPNSRHSIYTVKDKYRTIPFGLTAEEKKKYIGKVIDNKGNFLPKQYDGTKNGAKTDKYINKRYDALKKSKSSAFELIELIKEYHLANQEGKSSMAKLYLDMPRYAIDNVVEAFQAGQYGERYSQIKSNVSEMWDQMWGKSKVDFENGFNYNPENNLVNTDLNGEQISYIPVTGIYNLDSDKVSPDVFRGLMRYALSLETHDVLLQNLPLVESLIDSLSSPEAQPKEMNKYRKDLYNAYGVLKNVTKKDSANQMLGQVKSLFEREFYGIHNSDTSEKYPRITKLLNGMQRLSAVSSLAVNIPSDLKNKYGAMVQLIIEGAGAEFVNLKDIANGRAWSFKTMTSWSSRKGIYAIGPPDLTVQMVEIFDPVFRSTDNTGKSISRSLYKDLIDGEWMYMHRKFGEMEVGLSLFGSFLHAQKLERTMPDGSTQTIRYKDAWEQDEDGIIKLKSGIHPKWNNTHVYHKYAKGESLDDIAKQYGITVEELKAKNKINSALELADGDEVVIAKSEAFDLFRNQVQGTSRLLFGTYDKFGQPEGNKFALYRLYMFMRKWFTPMFTNRFGAELVWTEGKMLPKFNARYDWALGKTRKGFYLTGFSAMVEMLKSRGKSYKYLTEEEKIAFRKLAADGLFVTAFALMASLLFGYDDDDEEKWEKIAGRSEAFGTDGYQTYGFLQNHMLNLLMGVQGETTAFIPLPKVGGINFGMDDYGKMLTSTSTAFGNTFLLYMQLFGDLLNIATFNEAAKFQRDAGPYSWEEKGDYKFWDHFMKAFGFTGSTGDPETAIKNLRNSASRIGV
jgi:LysM repeat protein